MQRVLKKVGCVICCALLVISLMPALLGCGEEEEIRYVSEGNSVFYLLGNVPFTRMMGMVVKTQNGKTIVIDGGTPDNAEYLKKFLSDHADDHVDAWFFTHPHQDHIGAFHEIFSNGSNVSVDAIYHCFPSVDELMTYGYRDEVEKNIWFDVRELFQTKFFDKTERIQADSVFVIDGIKITVLRVYDPAITTDFVNNSSVVYRIENENKSFLILGDLSVLGGEALMESCDPELLHTDYTQMAHHGQLGVSKEFYEYIKPQRCLWPTPEWLWDNNAGDGFDTGPWLTVRTREWMAELGVTEHYVAKDGTVGIRF